MTDYRGFEERLSKVVSRDSELHRLSFEELLAPIPRVDAIEREPAHSTVLIRAELDLPIAGERVTDTSRIEATLPTVRYCLERGWKVVLFGHLGRDPEASLEPVCEAMSEALGNPIEWIGDWLEKDEGRLRDEAVERVRSARDHRLFMFENTRKYDLECALWPSREPFPDGLFERLFAVAKDFRRLTDTEINEAIAASNTDFSSSVVPLTMAQSGMGFFLDREMKEHMPRVVEASFVVFSGQKMNKLDDLEAMVANESLDLVIVAGALATSLLKATAQLRGGDFNIGLAQEDSSSKIFVEPKRLEQARRIAECCRVNDIELVLPVDFVLDTEEVSTEIPSGRAQMDVGPATRRLYQAKTREYLAAARRSAEPRSMFYNGVFGKFEDPRFEGGTKAFIPLLKELTDAGVGTYVGGGEGRLALQKYGSLEDVTHAFTCGGTVLKCLAGRQIGYLRAMHLQNVEL